MHDEVDLTQISINEAYSVVETETNPSYETEEIRYHALKEVKEINVPESPNTTKFNIVMIIMMMILLLITLISIALSVTTFNRLASEQSKVLSHLENSNNDTKSALVSQLDTIQMNLSQKVLELVIAQSNISQNLNQLDSKLENFIPGAFLTQYLRLSTQVLCGPGLWHQLAYLNMSDPSQQCPSAWREYNILGVRVCGRPTTSSGNCASIHYITYQQYS